MEYAFSFFAKESRAAAAAPRGASAATWETVRWITDEGGVTCSACQHPPPLAWLALWAPGVFEVQLQMHRHGNLSYPPQALGGRVWVRSAAMTVPLPEHMRLTQLLRSQGVRVLETVPPAREECMRGQTRCSAVVAIYCIPGSVDKDSSRLESGLVYHAGRLPPSRGLPRARCAGPSSPCAAPCPRRFAREARGCARVLVITRPALVPQWGPRARAEPAVPGVTHDIHHFVQ